MKGWAKQGFDDSKWEKVSILDHSKKILIAPQGEVVKAIEEINSGYKHFYLEPHPGGGLTNANAEFASMYGKIKSAWKIEGENFVYEIEIPTNTTATITLPKAKMEALKLNEKMKKSAQQTVNGVKLELGSGNYIFRYPAAWIKL